MRVFLREAHRAWGNTAGSRQEEDIVKGRDGGAERNPQIVETVEIVKVVEVV